MYGPYSMLIPVRVCTTAELSMYAMLTIPIKCQLLEVSRTKQAMLRRIFLSLSGMACGPTNNIQAENIFETAEQQ